MMAFSLFLSFMFLMAGGMKLMTPKEKLAKKMAWANDFSTMQVKLIGLVEVLAALALSLPIWVELPEQTTLYSAVILLVLMIGAVGVHAKRKEKKEMMMPLMLLVLVGIFIYVL